MRKRESKTCEDSAITTDPDGNYTGVPNNPYEQTVQDVDDL